MLYYDYSGGVSISDTYEVYATFDRVSTVSSLAPEEFISPVLDAVNPVRLKVITRPSNLQVYWRASNLPFAMNDAFPQWRQDEPDNEYRYWQAKIILNEPHTVLDRVEFAIPDTISRHSELTFNL